jgi:hypothetical protein
LRNPRFTGGGEEYRRNGTKNFLHYPVDFMPGWSDGRRAEKTNSPAFKKKCHEKKGARK